MKLYGIVGAGGFGREVMPFVSETLAASNEGHDFEVVFVVEQGKTGLVNGHRVLTADEFLASPQKKRFNVAIADSQVRERIAGSFINAGAVPFSVHASNSVCLSNNEIGEGAILCPFTTVTSDATIGRFFHGNIYSYVAHDCRIGDFVTFAPNVQCNGRVVIEDHAYLGTGAILREGSDDRPIVIGRGAVVGMGAVVTRSVDPFATVIGNPAKPMMKK
jgi:sugar O-acyltransferase (sialic acid O-acetyltransferase NeuD family)